MLYIFIHQFGVKSLFFIRLFVTHFTVGKVAMATKTVYCFCQDEVCFETCPIQLFFIMIVDVGTILFQLKSKPTVIASIEYSSGYTSQILVQPYAKS